MRRIAGYFRKEPPAKPQFLGYVHVTRSPHGPVYEHEGEHFSSLHRAKNALRRTWGVASRKELLWVET